MIPADNSLIQIRQQGLSLVELLIAMLIGLFLLTGMATSFITSKKASVDRDQLSVLEDNGRFALEIISTTVEHAGYTPVANVKPLPHKIISSTADVVLGKCSDNSDSITDKSLFTNTRVSLDNANGDALAIAYYGDNSLFNDCGGNALPNNCRVPSTGTTGSTLNSEASVIYSAFSLENNRLNCTGSRADSIQVIADNIENIQFLYGIKSGNNNAVDRYLNASNMAGLWDRVVSIQVAVLVRSASPIRTTAEQKSYSLLDQKVDAPNDKYQRAVFTSTIRIRNTL